jgi:hypothetical protein
VEAVAIWVVVIGVSERRTGSYDIQSDTDICARAISFIPYRSSSGGIDWSALSLDSSSDLRYGDLSMFGSRSVRSRSSSSIASRQTKTSCMTHLRIPPILPTLRPYPLQEPTISLIQHVFADIKGTCYMAVLEVECEDGGTVG